MSNKEIGGSVSDGMHALQLLIESALNPPNPFVEYSRLPDHVSLEIVHNLEAPRESTSLVLKANFNRTHCSLPLPPFLKAMEKIKAGEPTIFETLGQNSSRDSQYQVHLLLSPDKRSLEINVLQKVDQTFQPFIQARAPEIIPD